MEILWFARGLHALLPGLVDAPALLLLERDVYDTERAPLVASASDEMRRDWFAALGAELGAEVRVALIGGAARVEVAAVRARTPFSAWGPELLDRSGPSGAFVFDLAKDVGVLLQRHGGETVARVTHQAASRLAAVLERDRAARVARAAAVVARAEARLSSLPGVAILGSPPGLPSPEMLMAGAPWEEASLERHRLRDDGRVNGWLAAWLAQLGIATTCFVWADGMGTAWLPLRVPPGADWLVEAGSGTGELVVLSGDRARALFVRTAEHEILACLVPVRALLDRVASLAELDGRLDATEGLRLAAPTGPRDADPAGLFTPPRRLGTADLVDASAAQGLLRALIGDLDVGECLPDPAKRDGAVGIFSLSTGHEAPLAFRTVFTFDDGQWLVDLWNTGLDRLFIARPDDLAVLGLLRVEGGVEAFLSPRSSS